MMHRATNGWGETASSYHNYHYHFHRVFFFLFFRHAIGRPINIGNDALAILQMQRVCHKQILFGTRESLMRMRRNDKSTYGNFVHRISAKIYSLRYHGVSRRPWNDGITYLFAQRADI